MIREIVWNIHKKNYKQNKRYKSEQTSLPVVLSVKNLSNYNLYLTYLACILLANSTRWRERVPWPRITEHTNDNLSLWSDTQRNWNFVRGLPCIMHAKQFNVYYIGNKCSQIIYIYWSSGVCLIFIALLFLMNNSCWL